jgi:hypothetical protein
MSTSLPVGAANATAPQTRLMNPPPGKPWVKDQTIGNPMAGLADIMKDNQSDVKKIVLNFFRQYFIPMDRGIGYMWRSLSQPINIYMKNVTFHFMRNVVTGPQMESILELNSLMPTSHDQVIPLDANGAYKIRPDDLNNRKRCLMVRSLNSTHPFLFMIPWFSTFT